jgi:hypothetical protein
MAQGDVWKRLRGTMRDLFGIGNEEDGFNIRNAAGVAEIRNAEDDAYQTLRAARIASGAHLNNLPTLLDMQGRIPNITFSFEGNTPPTGGTNSAKFGICHTDGTSYNAGQVVYDNGSVLVLIPTEVVRTLTTASAVNGTLNMIANGLYAWQGSSWVLKGDGAPVDQGINKCLEIPISTEGPYDSTTSIPEGARVVRTSILVDTAFSASTTVTVFVQGSTPLQLMGASDSKITKVGQYEDDEIHRVLTANEGVVRVNIIGTPGVGEGSVFVFYTTPSA